ncbi:uncharacterized protein BKA78DRAFT_291126 [Phyllosticta capitalensis]|uniref:uncharacterized protein n=1 Tax=Phyllosticta capitalensis TaxID=121624 RepID=UPI00312FEC4E
MVSSLDPSEELLRHSQQVVEPENTSELNRQRSNLGSGLADTLRLSPATEVGTSHARTVSPSEPDEDIEKPKGILRKPTEKFPEDPNPIREGVAPMKDSLKSKDVPPDARWTKIDRQLVCPEALTEAKERFEERIDCVIILRVLTKKEIQAFADRTRQIRESRAEAEGPYEQNTTESEMANSPEFNEEIQPGASYAPSSSINMQSGSPSAISSRDQGDELQDARGNHPEMTPSLDVDSSNAAKRMPLKRDVFTLWEKGDQVAYFHNGNPRDLRNGFTISEVSEDRANRITYVLKKGRTTVKGVPERVIRYSR